MLSMNRTTLSTAAALAALGIASLARCEDYADYEESAPVALSARKLTSSPSIFAGRVIALEAKGISNLVARVDKNLLHIPGAKVLVHDAAVRVEGWIKGENPIPEVIVEGVLKSAEESEELGLQVLATGNRYVFFTQGANDPNKRRGSGRSSLRCESRHCLHWVPLKRKRSLIDCVSSQSQT